MAEALAQLPFDVGDLRLQQLRQEKLLAESFSSHRTRHFELHFPRRAQRAVAERMGEILEQEYKRLQAWIPLKSDKVTVVQLLPWDDFKTNWSGGIEIVGLFDGKIRLPFAEVRYFPPALVEVLAHELAHAMIDERTGGLAPKWFHEALAQHVQSDSPRLNPIEGLMLKKSLIAFPLLDDILNTFASPVLVSIAYDEAAWSMHFIEARFGRRSIHRLLDGFERGLGTEEALAEAIDRPLARFDRELWDWCINEAPAAWSHQAAGL